MDEKTEKEFVGHTPGPWHVSENEWTAASDGWDVMTGPADSPLCVAADLRSGADARLIAAAPDLLRERDVLKERVAQMAADREMARQKTLDTLADLALEKRGAIIERDEARRQRDALAEALKVVEWSGRHVFASARSGPTCPWCSQPKPPRNHLTSHASDCAWVAALAKRPL